MEASIKLPRANIKDQNPHTQKRQIDVKRGIDVKDTGWVGYFTNVKLALSVAM